MEKEDGKTHRVPRPEAGPSEVVLDEKGIVGLPVKVARTGRAQPEEGWRIAEVLFRNGRRRIEDTFVKVSRPDPDDPERAMEKNLHLERLQEINPDIRFLVFVTDRDYVLYRDQQSGYKIGLVTDANLQEETLLVMLSPESDDSTAPLERIRRSDVVDKSADAKELEAFFHNRIKAGEDTAPGNRRRGANDRVSQRKNLIYYLKVKEDPSERSVGYAADISKQGFMLITKEPLEPESLLRLRLSLPAEIQGVRHFVFSAVSRWCREDVKPNYFNVGFQFVGLSKDDVLRVDELIDKYSF